MVVPFLKDLHCDLPINSLYSLEHIPDNYWLTNYNLVFDKLRERHKGISILTTGYPSVSFSIRNKTHTVTLHKIIALARINNGPYECIEHINDDPFDVRVSNLRFSTQRENALSAFKNNKRDCPEAIFKAVLKNGSVFTGTMRELQVKTGIPRLTLYDRYYKGPFDPNRKYAQVNKVTVLSVEKIEEAPEQKRLSIRSIDYRKHLYRCRILKLDRIEVVIGKQVE